MIWGARQEDQIRFLYILSGASGHFMAAETDPGADVRISGVTYETNRTF